MGDIYQTGVRCATCYKYPFCEKIVKPTGWCGNWQAKGLEAFKEVKNDNR